MNKEIEREFFTLLKLDKDSRFEFYLRLGYHYINHGAFDKTVAVLTRALGENK